MTQSNGMQYIVVQGRQPQDGSTPLEALVIFPAWVSATLMCAGVSGRVIELTDGSIKEGGPMAGGSEAELLEAIHEEFGGPQHVVSEPTTPDCTNEDSWNCKYCRKTENCEALNSQGGGAPEPAVVLSFVDSREKLVDWLLNQGNFTREYLEGMLNSDLIAMAKDKRLAPGSWMHLTDEPRPSVGRFPGSVEQAYEGALNEILELERKLKIAQDNLEHTVNYMNEGCTCGRAPAPKHTSVPNPTPADYAELRDRIEELTDVNQQQQRELAAQDQELERLRTLLAGIRRLAKKGKA